MSIALVTGAHGFLGRHVARALSRKGHQVHGLGHGAWTSADWSAWGLSSWRAGEVTLENLLESPQPPDLLVHCAGSGSVSFSLAQPLADFRRTVDTTAAALEYLRLRSPAAAFVFPSSGSVYGSHEQGLVPETAPASPLSPYAAHKSIAEALCASYGRSFGIRSVVFRLFSLYGPGLRKQLLWDACTRLTSGDAAFGGTGEEVRDWLHVEDAAELMVRGAPHASASSPLVNGGSGAGTTVREVVSELAQALGGAARVRFTGAARAGDPFRFVAETALARSWGWQPRIPWRDGVRAYAAWFASGAP